MLGFMKSPHGFNRRQFIGLTTAAALPLLNATAEPLSPSPPKKIQVGCLSWCFHSLGPSADPEAAIDNIGTLGFDGIELIATSRGDFKTFWTDERISRLKQKVERNKLRVSQFAMFQPVVENLTSLKREDREQ